MCTGGLLTEWSGVTRLDDVTEDTLALMFAVKPAPGARAFSPWLCPVTFVLGVRQACRGWRVVCSCRSCQDTCQGPCLHASAATKSPTWGRVDMHVHCLPDWSLICTACFQAYMLYHAQTCWCWAAASTCSACRTRCGARWTRAAWPWSPRPRPTRWPRTTSWRRRAAASWARCCPPAANEIA